MSYSDLKNEFNKLGIKKPTIIDCRNIISNIRKCKLPPIDSKIGSAGSFFKNPIVSKDILLNTLKINNNIKWFRLNSNNKFKISAASLIEAAGLKGYEINGVGTFKNQPLVIVNLNNCDGKTIWEFSKFIVRKVNDFFGIELIPEVNIWD